MSAEIPTGQRPTNELDCAEATLVLLQGVLDGIANADLSNQTPCSEFDVAKLTDHLMNSITVIGGAAGAVLPERDKSESVAQQIAAAARPALDAWHRRGLDGTVPFGPNQAPATLMAGILSLEFLVHAWDYAVATGQQVQAPEAVADFVLAGARNAITDQARSSVGFAEAIEVPADASAQDRLIAFTGRNPVR
jgi:uncharacterized protein (TIGR03086 family)